MPSNSDLMNIARQLDEGMWAGDLNDLVASEVSVDEYESKVDDKAIVIGFFVHDIDAASDLNRFIQKSTVDILYSEVSPAPDQRGYYIVFVELIDNANLAENISDLIEEVTYLTNVEEWTANVFGMDKAIKVSTENLETALKTARKADGVEKVRDNREREETVVSRVGELKKKLAAAQKRLSESTLDSVEIANGGLILTSRARPTEFDLEYIGPLEGLDTDALSVDFNSLRECRNLAMNLGEGWDVAKTGESFILHLMEQDVVVVLRPVE